MSSASSSPVSDPPSDLEEPEAFFLDPKIIASGNWETRKSRWETRKSRPVTPSTKKPRLFSDIPRAKHTLGTSRTRQSAKPASKASERQAKAIGNSVTKSNLRRSTRQSVQDVQSDSEDELPTTRLTVPDDSSTSSLSPPQSDWSDDEVHKDPTILPDAEDLPPASPQAPLLQESKPDETPLEAPDVKPGEQPNEKPEDPPKKQSQVTSDVKADGDLGAQLQAVRELSLDPHRAPSVEPSVDARTLPKRTRKAPTRLDTELTAEPPRKPSARPARSTRGPNLDPHHVMTSKNSILTKPNVNLQKLLCDDRAWDFLSREQQIQLIRPLPDVPEIDPDETKPIPNWPRERLLHHNAFRSAFLTGLRTFKENLAAGRWDPEWIRQAEEASKERAAGLYDEWKVAEREEYWGQKMNGTNA